MALDGAFLRHIKYEVKKQALDARVDKIFQPNKDEIVISLRCKSGTYKLLLSVRASSPRVHFTKHKIENPSVPPMLCMLFRKKLTSAKLIDVRQVGLERALFFDFLATDELGDKSKITIVSEIMGKYSNVILLDSSGKIIDALKRVDASTSSKRLVLPGIGYELPPKQDKLSLLDEDADIVDAMLKRKPGSTVEKAMLSCIQGISPIVCREAAYAVCGSKDIALGDLNIEQKESLKKTINSISKTVFEVSGNPIMIKDDNGKLIDFSFLPIKQYGESAKIISYESFSELLDEFYFEKDNQERMKTKYADLSRLLTTLLDRINKKIAIQKNEIEQSKKKEVLKLYGDLLKANLYKLSFGEDEVVVENFYDEYKPTKIKLDSRISPSQNVQKFYKEYTKSKHAIKLLNEQIELSKVERDYLEGVLDTLSRVQLEDEINEIRSELAEQGYIKSRSSRKSNVSKLKPMRFKSTEGFEILVGRNNIQNDKLTLKESKKTDIWFHVKDIPGSHVILVANGKEVGEQSLYDAAMIAAFYSKAGGSSGVPVDYTFVRYVSKPQGAKPGNVIYKNQKTLFVTPNKDYISNLSQNNK